MDAATRSRIFEPFFTTKAAGKGTGLGLATVRDNVLRLKGIIQVDSAFGKGSTFRVLLPLAAESPPSASLGPPAPLLVARGLTVLLAEDEGALRRAARLVLERAGYAVTDAADGAQALQRLQALPDVLVADVVMPALGGRALAAELRRRRPGLPVVFVSGFAGEAETLEPDVSTVSLSKPYSAAQLLEAVGQAVGEVARLPPDGVRMEAVGPGEPSSTSSR